MSKNDSTSGISEKLSRLDQLVAWFEGDDFSLDEAFEKFSEAEQLVKEIDKNLDEYSNKITVLKKDFSA